MAVTFRVLEFLYARDVPLFLYQMLLLNLVLDGRTTFKSRKKNNGFNINIRVIPLILHNNFSPERMK